MIGEKRASRVAWLIPLIALGCAQTPTGIPLVEGLEQEDIPVKETFEFVRSESFQPDLHSAGTFRSWTGVYHGSGILQDLGPWYVSAMADQGWKLTRRLELTGPEYTFTFVKGGEEAVVQLSQVFTSALGRPVKQAVVSIHPRGPESLTTDDIDVLKHTARSQPREEFLTNDPLEPTPAEAITSPEEIPVGDGETAADAVATRGAN